jgi:hypothetical protein
MSRSARVTSIETVEKFRAALCAFGVEARDALSGVDMTLRRMFDWLKERTQHWQREVKVRHEELLRAKMELENRKYSNRDGRGAGTANQEKNFRKAQARLKEAEEKLANCKRWVPLLEHAARDYYAPARQLSGALDSDLVNALALLKQKLDALEAYLTLAPPSTPMPAAASTSVDEMRPREAAVTVATPAPAVPEAAPEGALPPVEDEDSVTSQ